MSNLKTGYLDAFVDRAHERAVRKDIMPLAKAKSAHQKSVEALAKANNAVKDIINAEAEKNATGRLKAEQDMEVLHHQIKSKETELQDVIAYGGEDERGIKMESELLFAKRKLKALEEIHEASSRYSDEMKARLSKAVATAKKAERDYIAAHIELVLSIDLEMERVLGLYDTTGDHRTDLSRILYTPAVLDAFAKEDELRHFCTPLDGTLANIIESYH